MVHELSLWAIPYHSAYYGKFTVCFGCHIPSAELYRRNGPEKDWIVNSYCCIRNYRENHEVFQVSNDPETFLQVGKTVKLALKELANLTDTATVLDIVGKSELLYSETPSGIIAACMAYDEGQVDVARDIITDYLEHVQTEKIPMPPHYKFHIAHVEKWREQYLL